MCRQSARGTVRTSSVNYKTQSDHDWRTQNLTIKKSRMSGNGRTSTENRKTTASHNSQQIFLRRRAHRTSSLNLCYRSVNPHNISTVTFNDAVVQLKTSSPLAWHNKYEYENLKGMSMLFSSYIYTVSFHCSQMKLRDPLPLANGKQGVWRQKTCVTPDRNYIK